MNIPLILKIYLNINRIIGITFGGLVIRNDKLEYNRNLKILGNVLTLFCIILFVGFSQMLFQWKMFYQFYKKGFLFMFYLLSANKDLREVLVVLNLLYIQTKSSKLFEFLSKYSLKRRFHKILISSLFITNYMTVVLSSVLMISALSRNHSLFNNSTECALGLMMLGVFESHIIFAVPFISWGKYSQNFLII